MLKSFTLSSFIFLLALTIQNGLAQQCTSLERGKELMSNLSLTTPTELIETTTVSQSFFGNETTQVTLKQTVNLQEQRVQVEMETIRGNEVENPLIMNLINGVASRDIEGTQIPLSPSRKAILYQALIQQSLLPREYTVIDCQDTLPDLEAVTGNEQVTIETRLGWITRRKHCTRCIYRRPNSRLLCPSLRIFRITNTC